MRRYSSTSLKVSRFSAKIYKLYMDQSSAVISYVLSVGFPLAMDNDYIAAGNYRAIRYKLEKYNLLEALKILD